MRFKRTRTWLRRLAWGVLALLVLLALAVGLVQTPFAKARLGTAAAGVLSRATPWDATVEGLSGLLPFNTRLESFALADEDGPWLAVRDLRLTVNPWALVAGRVHVAALTIDSIDLPRLPAGGEETDDSPTPAGPLVFPDLPDAPAWLRVDRLAVERLTLGETLAKEEVTLSVEGSYAAEPGLAVHIARTDGAAAQARLTAGLADGQLSLDLGAEEDHLVSALLGTEGGVAFELRGEGPMADWSAVLSAELAERQVTEATLRLGYGAAPRLRLDGTLHADLPLVPEAARDVLGGDAVAVAIDATLHPDRRVTVARAELTSPALALAVSGTAGLADLALDLRGQVTHVDLAAVAPDLFDAAAPARLDLTATGGMAALAVEVDGTLDGADLLRGAWGVTLDPAVSVSGTLDVQPAPALPEAYRTLLEGGGRVAFDVSLEDGRQVLRKAEVTLPAGTVVATAELDPAGKALSARVTADLSDAARLGGLLPVALSGAAHVDAEAAGDGKVIDATVAVTAREVAVDTARLAGADLRFDVAAGWLDAPLAGLSVRGGGTLTGVRPEGFDAQDVTLEVDLALEEGRLLRVASLDVSSPWGTAAAGGRLDLEDRAGDLDATLEVPSLAPLLALAGATGDGAVSGTAALRAPGPDAPVAAEARLAATGLAGLPGGAAELLGGAMTIETSGTLAGEDLRVSDLRVTSPNVTASGAGTLRLDTRELEASAEGAVEDLSPIAMLAGRPVAGAATWTAEVSGPLDTLAAQVRLEAKDAAFDAVSLERLDIAGNLRRLPGAPTGNVTVRGARGDRGFEAAADLATDEAGYLLKTLNLRAGENRVTGGGRFNPATRTATADLAVGLTDLAYLGAAVGMPLAGSLAGVVRLEARGDGSGALLADLEASGVETPYGGVAALSLDTELMGPEHLRVLRFALAAEDAFAGETRIARLEANASGDLDGGIEVEGRLRGVLSGDIPLETELAATVAEGGAALELVRLDGRVGNFPFALETPATATWREGRGELSLVSLTLADGRVSAGGYYGPEGIDLHAGWEGLPLALAELVRDLPVTGAVSGNARLSGSPAGPRAELTARVEDLRAPELAEGDAALAADIFAGLDEGGAFVTVQGRMPEALELEANVRAPARLTLDPPAFDLPLDQPITGNVQLDSDLAPTVKPFRLAGHELAGKAEADLALGGTLAMPTVTGELTLADGAYTNTVTGTALRELAVVVHAEGRRAVIDTLRAKDPAAGTVEGSGSVDFAPGTPVGGALDMALKDFRLADRDDFTGLLNGTLGVAGSAEGLAVTGDLVLGPATIRLPGQVPPAQLTPVAFETAGEAPGETAKTPGPLEAVSLDLRLSSPGRVDITSPVLKTEWRADLRVSGTAADPRVDGSLGVVRGNLDFLGRRFDLAESTITFDKSRPPDPYIDLRAASRSGDITATLRLDGTMDDLEMRLGSEPALPEDEVLARVLFGRSLADITPVQALQLVRVADMLRAGSDGRRLFAGDVRTPGLSRIDVTSGANPGETALVMGQYLTDRIYVELEQGSGRDSSRAQVEAELSPQFSVRGTAESTGGSGVGLFWKRDY